MTFDEAMTAVLKALEEARFAEGIVLLDRAETLAGDDAEHALVQMQRAAIPLLQNNFNSDLNVFRENLVRRHSRRHVWIVLYYLTIAAIDRNDRESADRYLPQFLEITREMDEPDRTVRSFDVLAAVESLRGNHVAAIEYNKAALAESERLEGPGAESTRAFIAHNLVYNCLAANEYREALVHTPGMIEMAEKLRHEILLRQGRVTAAFAYLVNNMLDEAETLAIRAAEVAIGTRLERYVHYVRGEVARRRGNRAEAAAHFRKLEPLYPDIPGVAEMLLSMNVAEFLVPE
jgi:tetratricopeptide (TPR) repeat protein